MSSENYFKSKGLKSKKQSSTTSENTTERPSLMGPLSNVNIKRLTFGYARQGGEGFKGEGDH